MAGGVEVGDQDSEDDGFLTVAAEDISRIREQQDYSGLSDAFVHWAVKQISPKLSDSEILSATAPKGPGERGIDAAWFDPEALYGDTGFKGVYYVAQGKCPADLATRKKFGATPVKDLQRALTWLEAMERKSERSELRAVKNEFKNIVVDSGYPCIFAILLWGHPTEAHLEFVEDVNHKLYERDEGKMAFEVFDAKRLYGLYITRLEEGDIETPQTVDFRISTKWYMKRNDIADALVAEVPLRDIYLLYRAHGLGLFAKNLRVPIAGSLYNEGIENTLDDADERSKFWFYNNGLTAICDNFSIEAKPEDPESMTTVTAKRMQIVNGCQTCASVFNVARVWGDRGVPLDPLDNITVLIRLIKVGKAREEDPKFPHSIARYTNSQTPITHRDLHSTDPEQIRLKERFAQDWNYFLEVKRGEWRRRLELNRQFRNRFDAPFYFTNEKCGQAFVAFWDNDPALAKTKKVKIFEDEKRYQSIFGFDTPTEGLLLPMLLWTVHNKWRRKRGYSLRDPKAKARYRTKVTKKEVSKHGNLYLLSIVGASMQSGWKAHRPKNLRPGVLKTCCRNAKELMSSYSRPTGGRVLQTVREFDNALDEGLKLLYWFAREKVYEDEDLTVRNLLVRPPTWGEFAKQSKSELKKVAQQLRLRLESNY